MTLLLGIFTFLLVLISLFMVLVILAQRAKSDGGVGAALGGGMAEAAFGAESGNVLSRATTIAAVTFFILSFGLYLGHLHLHRKALREAPEGLPAAPALVSPDAEGAAPLAVPEGMAPLEPPAGPNSVPPAESTKPAVELTLPPSQPAPPQNPPASP